MASVLVDEMRCLDSSDSADDIYLMTFRGNTTAPFASNVGVQGPGNFWDDFDATEVRKQDIAIAQFRTDAVYVVMLVDQDSGRDIDTEALGLWKTMTDVAWKAMMVSQTVAGLGTGAEQQRAAAAAGIVNAFLGAASATIRAPKDPDDRIGLPKRLSVTPGKTTVIDFKESGGDGHYKVTFKVQ